MYFGIKEYSYKNQFSTEEQQSIISYLDKNFYDLDNVERKYAGYQTPYDFNLFYVPKKEFHKLRRTFVDSVFDYVNTESVKDRIENWEYKTKTWCYMNWKQSDRNGQVFHIHNNDNPYSVSGIFYLKVNNEKCGTKFIVGANEIEIPSIECSWFIFPSNYGHIPGENKTDEKRYVISADIWF